MKITNKMVKYWLGESPETRLKESIRVIREIANSNRDAQPWTPQILHNDINQTWNNRDKELTNGN